MAEVTTKTLQNGVKIIVKKMEGLLSVTAGVLVGTGSAYETDEEDGISHFLEHMQFKGTDKLSAFQINDKFDELGAQANAFTGKDLTCFYVKSTSDHIEEAFSLLAHMCTDSVFPEEEMEREKGVVVEEINMYEDSPEDLCLDLLSLAAFGKDTYGRNVLGPKENVLSFTRENLFAYKAERYRPDNIVVSFAGNINVSLAEEMAERAFGSLKPVNEPPRAIKANLKRGEQFKQKSIEQAHLAIGFPSIPRDSDFAPALQVVNAVLGGGMSSRLVKRVREELGLAYSVYSYPTFYADTGYFTVYAGVNPKKAEKALKAVKDVILSMKKEGVTQEEFLRGREQLKSGSIFAQESTSSQMLLYGKQLLYKNEVYDFERKMNEIASLRQEDIAAALELSFDFEKASFASVGNFKNELHL